MGQSNLRCRWLFWHDGLRDTFDRVAVVDRWEFKSTVAFYRDVVKTLGEFGADAKDALEYLDMEIAHPEPNFKLAADVSATVFRNVAKTLPYPFFIGVTTDLRLFVVARIKDGAHDRAKPVTRYGKWRLIDDVAWAKYNIITGRGLFHEPSNDFPKPCERAYRDMIEALLQHGAQVTYLEAPSDIWNFPHYHFLPDALDEAIRTLPKPRLVGIDENLLWFYIVVPL